MIIQKKILEEAENCPNLCDRQIFSGEKSS
jgi:hypothetical protein